MLYGLIYAIFEVFLKSRKTCYLNCEYSIMILTQKIRSNRLPMRNSCQWNENKHFNTRFDTKLPSNACTDM